MYLSYWGLESRPFGYDHSASFFVPCEEAVLTLGKLRYVITSKIGVALLAGEAGVGKSEVLRVTIRELERADWVCAYVPNPSGECADVLSMMARILGSDDTGQRPMDRLLTRLQQLGEIGAQVCILVDDCHTISDNSLLESFRMMLNLEHDGHPVANLVLAGQEDMEQRMRSASGFASHLAMKVWLRPLTQEDTKNYVLYRLKAAGCQRGLFTRQAADAIFQYTGGFPRNINRLCELSLTIACGLQAKKIGPEIIETAAENLGLESDILDALGQTGAGCGEADILSSIPA